MKKSAKVTVDNVEWPVTASLATALPSLRIRGKAGEWHRHIYITAGHTPIATVYGKTREEAESRAKLILLAVGKLLAEHEDLISFLKRVMG